MKAEYKHTQFGVWMFVVLFVTGIVIAFVSISIFAEGRFATAIIIVCLYLLGLALFYSFTIEISDGKLKFWFGIGGVGKSYALEEIQSVQEAENPWYYFWGIKSIPDGWLFAIAPGSSVEVVFKNGKMIRIGTDQPKRLKQAIDDAMTAN